jgi:putative SOS response-associated peptidase YedK
MCGRFTVKATWAELVALYRLTMDAPPHNLRPRYNVCPTDPVDVVTAEDDKRELIPMRWGLVPRWWINRPSRAFSGPPQFTQTKLPSGVFGPASARTILYSAPQRGTQRTLCYAEAWSVYRSHRVNNARNIQSLRWAVIRL